MIDRHLVLDRETHELVTKPFDTLEDAEAWLLEARQVEDVDRWMLVHSQAEAYPEVLCWTTLGFCNRMAEEHGAPGLWYWERPQPDLVRFRMNRAV